MSATMTARGWESFLATMTAWGEEERWKEVFGAPVDEYEARAILALQALPSYTDQDPWFPSLNRAARVVLDARKCTHHLKDAIQEARATVARAMTERDVEEEDVDRAREILGTCPMVLSTREQEFYEIDRVRKILDRAMDALLERGEREGLTQQERETLRKLYEAHASVSRDNVAAWKERFKRP